MSVEEPWAGNVPATSEPFNASHDADVFDRETPIMPLPSMRAALASLVDDGERATTASSPRDGVVVMQPPFTRLAPIPVQLPLVAPPPAPAPAVAAAPRFSVRTALRKAAVLASVAVISASAAVVITRRSTPIAPTEPTPLARPAIAAAVEAASPAPIAAPPAAQPSEPAAPKVPGLKPAAACRVINGKPCF